MLSNSCAAVPSSPKRHSNGPRPAKTRLLLSHSSAPPLELRHPAQVLELIWPLFESDKFTLQIIHLPDGIDQGLLVDIFRTLIDGLEDYTVDSRGDIGAIVRESAMSSIQVLLRFKEFPEQANDFFVIEF